MLTTRFTELFDLEYPVMSAPMSGHSNAVLAAAVSKAGGLGTFGGTDERGPEWVREQISAIREETDRPFAVGYIPPLWPLIGADMIGYFKSNRSVNRVVNMKVPPGPF